MQITDAIKSGLSYKEQFLVNQLYWDEAVASIDNFENHKIIALFSQQEALNYVENENLYIKQSLTKEIDLEKYV